MTKSISDRRTAAASQNIKERDYWLTKLSGELQVNNFPPDYKKEKQSVHSQPEFILFCIPDEYFPLLMKLCNEDDAMLYMTLAAELTLLLYKYTGNPDIILASPICKQDTEGEFINTVLALRNRLEGTMSFKDLLLQVGQSIVEAEENQNYPFEILFQKLDIPLEDEGASVLGTAIALTNIHDREYIRELQTDVLFSFSRTDIQITGSIEYNPLLYKKTTINLIISHFINLLGNTLRHLDMEIHRFGVMTAEEIKRLIDDFNYTDVGYPGEKTVHQLFEEQVNRTPDKTALSMNNDRITYRLLNEKANRLAHLLREKNVRSDTIVSLLMDRSIEMIIGILGILKAGGGYLPVDPGSPPNRILFMLEDSNSNILLANASVWEKNFLDQWRIPHLSNEDIHVTPGRLPISTPDNLPLPDRSAVDYEKYGRFIGQAMVKNSIALQATRGCPYRCAYCHRIWSKHHVYRSAEHIFTEILLYYNLGVKRFVFIDDIFNLNHKNSTRLFKLILDNKLKVQLFFPNGLRGDILTKEYIDLMVEAGTVNAALALETASPRLQKLIGKNLNLLRFRENVEYFCQKHPQVVLELFTMHGFPTETREEALMTLDFIKSLKWLHFPYVHILKIYPNTAMYQLGIDSGISAEAISKSAHLAYHELPPTLPFPESFTITYQADFLNEYFLSRERLLRVLPYQMKVFTESEIIEKYDSYLPAAINNFQDLLQLAGLTREEFNGQEFLSEDYAHVPNLNSKLKKHFEPRVAHPEALKILLIDLSLHFSQNDSNMLYDVVEPPLGLLYLSSYLNRHFGGKIDVKISKSRVDFDSNDQLKALLDEFKPDVIGARTLTFYKNFFHKTMAKIRQWGFNKTIIAGGPYASSDYQTLLADRNIDMVVLGEGEITLAEIIEKIMANSGQLPTAEVLQKIPGIAYVHRQKALKQEENREILFMDTLFQSPLEYAGRNDVNPENTNKPADMAYIIYTSGTTGAPKGTIIEHRNVVRLFFNDKSLFDFNSSDIWTMFHSYSFDFSVWEMYGALLYGGRLAIIPKEITIDISQYLSLLKKETVTVLNQTPSVFYRLIDEELKSLPAQLRLRYVIFGGEALTPGSLEKFAARYRQTKLINMYGITETTVHVTIKEIGPREIAANISNIGIPIPTLQVYILDKNLNPTPPGVPGELCVAGDGVGRGYLNRPPLTGEKFITNPFSPGSRLYRSGDCARMTEGMEIEYLGRIDNQVKIRGFRIELGEIEKRLSNFEDIKECVVIYKDDLHGEKYLCAYIRADQPIDLTGLKVKLSSFLPEYMIPSYIVQLPKIPLTANGKVNKKALPDPKGSLPVKMGYKGPRNKIEEKLVEIWAGILGIRKDQIGINVDFFEIGGHSLNATRLVSAMHKELDVVMPFADLFKTSTIEGIAEFITKAGKQKYSAITPAEQKEYYLLSSAQKRLYILHLMEIGDTSYNSPFMTLLEGELNLERFEEAIRGLIKRHEILRTSFVIINNQSVQIVHKEVNFNVTYREMNEKEAEIAAQEFIKPFQLDTLPLLRIELVKMDEQKFLLMVDLHHIITDGISMQLFIKEFMALYAGHALAPLTIQYKDFSEWQNRIFLSEEIKKQQGYWLMHLEGEIPILEIPADYRRPTIKRFDGNSISFRFTAEEITALKAFSQKENATLFMVLLALFNVLLARISGQEDIIVGTPIAGRRHADLHNTMGMFVNTIAIRNFPLAEKSFREFLEQLKERTLAAFENQDYPFEKLVEQLVKDHDTSRNPLFDIMLSFHNIDSPGDGIPGVEIPGLKAIPYKSNNLSGTSQFDITLSGIEFEDNLALMFTYCTRLFKQETIERFITYFKKITAGVLNDPEIKLYEIDILPDNEKKQVLDTFNNTQANFPVDKTIHRLFAEQVKRTPDHIAISGPTIGGILQPSLSNPRQPGPAIVAITYHELNEKSQRLAHTLRLNGIESDSIVGLMMERSVEMMIGIFGIFKASGAYLPIDPGYPQERIDYILKDSNTKMLINVSIIENLTNLLHQPPPVFPVYRPTNLAYVIYTSGSTGKPKGALLEHRGMMNHLYIKITDLQIDAQSVVAQTASHTFDISIWQFFSALVIGGKTIIYPHSLLMEPDIFISSIIRDLITILEIVPSYLTILFDSLERVTRISLPLKYLLVTGEEVKSHLVKKWFQLFPGIKMVNAYGPTEASDDITHYIMDMAPDMERIPIGRPLQNLKIYIVDEHMNLCPIGIKGEICVSGIGVGRGYLNDEKRTGQVFIEDPFRKEKGVRLYKTGDLGFWHPDGNIEFLGRKDYQVKINGFRIECGEIENQLLQHPKIRQAVVISLEANGEMTLCAYFVLSPPGRNENTASLSGELREYLSRLLPVYMIPSFFIPVEHIPLLSNGKVDRKALAILSVIPTKEYTAPRNKIEQLLIEIWSTILGQSAAELGIDANFFQLGGNSLNAILVVSKIHKDLNIKIQLADIFRCQTIRALSDFMKSSHESIFVSLKPAEKKEYYLMSSAQKRMFIWQQMYNDGTFINSVDAVALKGPLNIQKLENTFRQMIQRHETLRTSFHLLDGKYIQKIHPEVDFEIEYSELENKANLPVAVQKLSQTFIRPYSVELAPLFRVALVRIDIEHYLLIIDMHHIITDGMSMGIIFSELMSFYEERQPTPLTLQYKDFAEWQNQFIESGGMNSQEEFWLKLFENKAPALNLPIDFARPDILTNEGSYVSSTIAAEEIEIFRWFVSQEQGTMFMGFLAIVTVLLFKDSGQEDIVVGSPVACRRHEDTQNIIGMFSNILVLRNQPNKEDTFRNFFKKVKENALLAIENQEYPFEDIVKAVSENEERDSTRNALFDVMFDYQDIPTTKNELSEIILEPSGLFVTPSVRYDLEFHISENTGNLGIVVGYRTALFKENTIKNLIESLKIIFAQVVKNPDIRLSEIELLREEEQALIAIDFNIEKEGDYDF